VGDDVDITLTAECYFYLFANVEGRREESGSHIKTLVDGGTIVDEPSYLPILLRGIGAPTTVRPCLGHLPTC
jgi:hypothetical protein